MKRRTSFAALAAIASAAAWPAGVLRAEGEGDAYRASVARGEAALARGDADAATAAFDSAARMRHAADSEMGLVHAAMLRGRYREALAFCAHVAGAHLDEPGSAALYAWLLRVGGQSQVAGDVLAKALARSPDEPVLRAAHDALAADWPVASGILLARPSRLAPESWSSDGRALTLRDARTICSGVVVDDGARVLVPASSVARIGRRRLWVRNGLGTTTSAAIESSGDASSRLAVLRLADALPLDAGAMAPREPFAGSPGFVVQYAAGAAGTPAWPLLWQGFVGGQASDGLRQVGIDVPPGNPGGGPVLDAAGRIAGATLAIAGGLVFVPRSAWPGTRAASTVDASAGRASLVPLDQAYERALRAAAQVVVEEA